MRTIALLVVLCSCLCSVSVAEFDPEAYRTFLEQTRDLTAEGLLHSREPFGPYHSAVADSVSEPCYLPEITRTLRLTEGELTLLRRHGFVVSRRLSRWSFGAAYEQIWHDELPVFVSTDAILHAVHKSYDELLKVIEDEYLRLQLDAVLQTLHASWPALKARYAEVPRLKPSIDDLDVYITVARSLLYGQTIPSQGGNDATVDELLTLIAAERPVMYPLFNSSPRWCDFSQMKARGHYVDDLRPLLAKYFRTMMWLGRTEFRLTEPPGEPVTPDVTREIIDARLLCEMIRSTDAGTRLVDINAVITALVGLPDNVTADDLTTLARRIRLTGADQLLEPEMIAAFRRELATGAYTSQAINSQIIYWDPFHPGDINPPYAFLLMGQRFIADSHILGKVVFPWIPAPPDGFPPERLLPSPLDALYCLGNDDALPLLHNELELWRYAPNLAALRYLYDGYDSEFWSASLYNVWLQAIRSLAGSERLSGVPPFMTTGAWQQEKINTQLAAWAELRHDNLLYAKQSYTGGSTCSFPSTYIEPIPAFYRTIAEFAAHARSVFATLPMNSQLLTKIDGHYALVGEIMTRLGGIAEKELNGQPYTPDEEEILARVIYRSNASCAKGSQDGWYRGLYFTNRPFDAPAEDWDAIIADVHTDPNRAQVLHAATGSPEFGIFLATPPAGDFTAYVGPVSAYHEVVTGNSQRLSDNEWKRFYGDSLPDQPDWTNVYLADRSGAIRAGGRRLVPFPDSPDPGPPEPPASAMLRLDPTVPNPFSTETLIRLRVDGPAPAVVRLDVFSTSGALVKTLLDETLPPSTYLFRWDGTDRNGRSVALGVYQLRARSGFITVARKVLRIR
jgi:hypothetical protein